MRIFRLLFLILLALAFALAGCKGEDGKKVKKEKTRKVKNLGNKKSEEKLAEEEGEDEEEAAEEEEEEELTDTVVARVNGKDIDVASYVERLKKLTKGRVTRSMLKKTVIDRMINDALLAQEIEKLHIVVTDEEVAAAMNMDMERFDKQKAAMSARVKAFTERVAIRKLLKARGLLKDATDDELKTQYERRFGLKLDAVVMPTPRDSDAEGTAAAQQRAVTILEAAREGATLREAVKDKKAPNGRRIIVKPMFIKKGDERHAELWAAANPLKEKELGGPIKTAHGFVVFQLSKRIEPRQSYEEMKKKLAKSALNMKTAQAKHRMLEDLRKAAEIEYLIEFKKQSAIPRMHGGLRGGRIAPGLPSTGRDVLRRPGPSSVRGTTGKKAPKPVREIKPSDGTPSGSDGPASAPEAKKTAE